MTLSVLTTNDRQCEHPAHMLTGNPYRVSTTASADKVWVMDCRCGDVTVLGELTVRRVFGLTSTLRERREALLRAGGLYVGQHLTEHGGDVLHGPEDTSPEPGCSTKQPADV